MMLMRFLNIFQLQMQPHCENDYINAELRIVPWVHENVDDLELLFMYHNDLQFPY